MAVQNRIVKVQKRNRALVKFDESLIRRAILRAAESIGGFRQDYLPAINEKIFDAYGSDDKIAEFLAEAVVVCLNSEPHHLIANFPPTIEIIQDEVLHALRSYGFQNTAVGDSALSNNFRGVTNTALGFQAASGANTTGTTAIGAGTLLNLTSGLDNTALGKQAGSGVIGADNVICIGAFVSGEDVDDSCYIGNIFSRPSPGGAAVFVNGFGKLGTAASSSRFKEKIKPMERASEALFALKPVTFRYKKEVDPASQSQFGLVAEDVEAVNPDLVVRDKEGKAYSVRYDQVNAMLLNEFLKEHRTVEELRATIAQQGKAIKVLTAGLQKVSEQIELSQSKPQLVDNAQ